MENPRGPGDEREGRVVPALLPPVGLLAAALGLPPALSVIRGLGPANEAGVGRILSRADGPDLASCDADEPAPESGWRGWPTPEMEDPLSETGSWSF